MCDLPAAGCREVLVRGGEGGSAVTNYNGSRGDKGVFILTLKTIADIGLVGYVLLECVHACV